MNVSHIAESYSKLAENSEVYAFDHSLNSVKQMGNKKCLFVQS